MRGEVQRRPGAFGEALFLCLIVVAPVVGFALLKLVPGLDVVFESSIFHVVVVSLIAACALQVAVFAAVVAARTREAAPVLVALGCLAVGVFMLGHGLTTPGIGQRPLNMWVARFPMFALTSFALALLLALVASARPSSFRSVAHHPRAVLATVGTIATLFVAAVVVDPLTMHGGAPLWFEETLRSVLTYVVAAVLGVTGFGYLRRWHLSRDPVQLALVAANWLAAEALLSMHLGALWHLSWWDYHALLLVGFGAAVYAIVTSYRRTRTIERSLAGLFLTDPLDQIELTQPDALTALVAAVEAKDGYTHGHSARVAEMSVRIGRSMGLGAKDLRRLAQGAILHDIGKIGIPDEILNKPGMLTPEERARIEEHPVIGWDIVRRAPSLRDALAAIRHHHERVDGDGYPDGLARDHIPLAARIVAVADVWDALTSDRAYRPAWSAERAVAHMASSRGSHFDPTCLDAFLALMADEGLAPAPAGDPGRSAEVVAEAAEACHHHPATKEEAARAASVGR
jgi:HD-GYP domain-containing protein (c-di-GMP phosphodiesterase class II)